MFPLFPHHPNSYSFTFPLPTHYPPSFTLFPLPPTILPPYFSRFPLLPTTLPPFHPSNFPFLHTALPSFTLHASSSPHSPTSFPFPSLSHLLSPSRFPFLPNCLTSLHPSRFPFLHPSHFPFYPLPPSFPLPLPFPSRRPVPVPRLGLTVSTLAEHPCYLAATACRGGAFRCTSSSRERSSTKSTSQTTR